VLDFYRVSVFAHFNADDIEFVCEDQDVIDRLFMGGFE